MITDSQKKDLIAAFDAYLNREELKVKAVHGHGGIENLSYQDICNLKENSPQFKRHENTVLYQNGREVGLHSQTHNTTFPIYMKVIYDGIFFSVISDFIDKTSLYEEISEPNQAASCSKKIIIISDEISNILAKEMKKRWPDYYPYSQMYLFAGIALFAGLLIAGACLSNPIIMILATVALIADIIALTCNGVHEPPHMRMI